MQVLLSRGVSEDDLETELEEKLLDIDRMRTYDEGVNAVLVASAADEIASLRAQIYHQADEIEQLKDRWGDGVTASMGSRVHLRARTILL